MEDHRSLRKFTGEANLKSNFILFNTSTSTLSQRPADPLRFDSTFSLEENQSDAIPSACHTNRRPLLKNLAIPTMCVIVPLTLLSAALLSLVLYGQHQIDRHSIFPTDPSSEVTNSGYILVNISNTWLLSLSSVSSTVAGLMAPIVMMIQMYLNAQAMQKRSTAAQFALGVANDLPTPYQLSLILGLCSGNPERLWRFERYSRATSNKIPPMMRRTAWMLKLSLLLSALMFIADQVLHYTTKTVLISQATTVDEVNAFGRGLTETCLAMSREENAWLPCSQDLSFNETQNQAAQNSIFFLQHGTSNVSMIELVGIVEAENQRSTLALLIPQRVAANIDYRASSIGVSAQCSPITSSCAMHPSDPSGRSTSFNCSENFWGSITDTPSQVINASAPNSDVPPLAFKWSNNLQFAFFEDSAWSIPYNSIGLNPSTGQGDPDLAGIPDSKLINPVYFAIAGSFDRTIGLAGADLSEDPGIYSTTDFLNFVLGCSYQTFEVEYTFQNGALGDFTITPTTNGSIAEIYHGSISIGSSDAQLQDILETAALESSGAALADTWAKLYSEQVLGVIGAFTSPRSNLEEQSRKSILVTKLPIPALAVLLALNLAYLPLGLCLFSRAYRQASHIDIRDLYARLSIPGVVTSFFGDGSEPSSSQGPSGRGFDEHQVLREATHVEAVLDEKDQYRLQPTWHGM